MGRSKGARKRKKKLSSKQQQKEKDKMAMKGAHDSSDASAENNNNNDNAVPRGLSNLGNTCFMNSVLQILCRVVPLRRHFISEPAPPGEGPLSAGLRAVFMAQNNNNNHGYGSAFSPQRLFTELGRIRPEYRRRMQQDSQEVLSLIVDTVKEEERARLAKAYRKAQALAPSPCDSSTGSSFSDAEATSTVDNKGYEDDIAAEEEEKEKPIPESKLITIIDNVMGGKYNSSIKCLTCKNKSPRFEAFHDIPLALHPRETPDPDPPASYPDAEDNTNNSRKNSRNPSKKQPKKGKHKNNKKKRKASHKNNSNNVDKEEASDSSQEYKDANNNPSTGTEEDAEKANINITPSEDINIPSLFDDSDDSYPVYGPALPGSSDATYGPALPVYGPALPESVPSFTADALKVPPPAPPPPPFTPGKSLPSAESALLTGNDAQGRSFEEQLQMQSDMLTPNNNDTNSAPRLGEVPTNTLISTDLSSLDEPHLVPGGAVIALGPPVPPANDNNNDNASASDCEFFGVSDDEPAFLQSLWGNDDVEEKQENTDIETKKAPEKKPASSSQFKAVASSFMNIFSPTKAPYGYASIEDSLLLAAMPETLDGDNQVVCEKCSRKARLESARANRANKKKARKATRISAQKGGPVSPNSLRDCIRSEFDPDTANGNLLEEREDSGATTSDEERMPLLLSPMATSDVPAVPNVSEDTNKRATGTNGATSPLTVSVSSASSSEDEGAYEKRRRQYTKEEEDALIERYAIDPKLEVRSAAQLQVLVDTAPETLVFHLKRFYQPAYGRSRKISGHVKFPLTLDLTKYMDEDAGSGEDIGSIATSGGKRSEKGNRSKDKKPSNNNYELTGISVHQGNYVSGHYIAYVRDLEKSDEWHYCSDSNVRKASLKEVMECEAYLLVYGKVAS